MQLIRPFYSANAFDEVPWIQGALPNDRRDLRKGPAVGRAQEAPLLQGCGQGDVLAI